MAHLKSIENNVCLFSLVVVNTAKAWLFDMSEWFGDCPSTSHSGTSILK